MKHRIFVYGLLRKGCDHPMSRKLQTQARFVSSAYFQGELYLVDFYPCAVPSLKTSSQVKGDLYEFENEDLLATLDEFEEVGPDFPTPNEYVRECRKVTLLDGREMNAWIYLFNRPMDQLLQIESGDFLRSRSEFP